MKEVWWQSGVIYQIYPRSFQDSNGDGIGDLAGIIRRLDYCVSLGVTAVWLSPIFPSPMADFGYDVSDYCDIHPLFGSLATFDSMVAEIKERGLKLILDFVPNHTSNQHPWFEESRSSRTSPKRDWYLWRDPSPDGGAPNNWLSQFGGSAWQLDQRTGQYYYHAFLEQQPDLNWRNPEVRAAMYDVLRFWMQRGVDGFRIDVLWQLIKDNQWRDNPPNPDFRNGQPPHQSQIALYNADRPEMQQVLTELRRVVNEFPERVLIGEIYLPVDRLVSYYGPNLEGVHLPFNFQLLHASWTARSLSKLIDQYESAIPRGGWPNWVLGNHDTARIATRLGALQARVAAMLLLTLRGTPTLYYGDEIGMANVPIPADRVQDPFERNVPGIGLGRDPSRTPMQWNDGPYAGFSTAQPWLPLAEDYVSVNVETEQADSRSLLSLYRALIALRQAHPALNVGEFEQLALSGELIAYIRRRSGEALLIALNLGVERRSLWLEPLGLSGNVVLSTYLDIVPGTSAAEVQLRAHEGVIVQLT